MADGIEFKINGIDEALEKLRTLAPRLQKKGLRAAARKAMNLVRDDARARAKSLDDPETSQKIWKNIITQESGKQGRRVGGVVMRVGVRGGASSNQFSASAGKNPGGDTRHWRYIEFGTQRHPAAPFMRPALATNIEQVINRFAVEFNSEITKAVGA